APRFERTMTESECARSAEEVMAIDDGPLSDWTGAHGVELPRERRVLNSCKSFLPPNLSLQKKLTLVRVATAATMAPVTRITLRLETIDRYLAHCFAAEDVPRASELAMRCGMSPAQLTRLFARDRGVRPSDYLKSRQVDYAKHLL